MRIALTALALAAIFAVSAGARAAEARGFTAKDLVMLDRVSEVRTAPDGGSALFVVRRTDWEADRGRTSLWRVNLSPKPATPEPVPGIGEGVSSPRWSADGRWIYFLSSRSGSNQVWRAPSAGGTPQQVTRLPLGVEAYRLSNDGRTLVVGLSVIPDCDSLKCTSDRLAAPAIPSGRVYDRLFVRHWDTWADGTRNQLFALQIDPVAGAATGEPVALTAGLDADVPGRPFGGEDDFALTPDGKSVIFSAKIAGKTEAWSTNFDLFQVPVSGGTAPVNLTPGNPAADSAPVLSPDGRTLAWLAMKRPGFEADRNGIMVRDLATGRTRELAPNWPRSAEALRWSPDGRRLYAPAQDHGETRLFVFDARRGGIPFSAAGGGHVGDYDVSRTGLVYTLDSLTSPAQVWSADANGRNLTQLTRLNAERLASVDMGEPTQFSFTGWNGDTVYGYVVRPPGARPGQKFPVAFLIHGGPQGSFGNLWHYRWNAQTYTGRGYAVVMIDFHGSTGYGQEFTDAISRHWGDRPLEDLQKGWAAALQNFPWLDGDRACALGGSYGGYMVNWIAGKWSEPWKCLVNHSGIFDTRAMAYSTEELWFTEWENGGMPHDDPASYERFNPVNHVAAWNRPMLVIHGQKDYRVPLEQGLATFTALQRRGIESRFVTFPDENHWILKPQNSVQWHDEVMDWLDRWTAAPAR